MSQLFLIGRVYGWDMPDTPGEVSEKESAEQLCEALEKGRTELQGSLKEMWPSDKPPCANCLMVELTKRNLIELIEEFLEFCEGQPFRINPEN